MELKNIIDIEKILANIFEYTLSAVFALIGLFIAFKLIGYATRLFEKTLKKMKTDETVLKFAVSAARALMKIAAVVSFIIILGVDKSIFIAAIGSMGLAIGLAFQGSLSNVASGVLIILFKPFKVGDFIESNGYSGFVEEIHILNTLVNTIDNKKVVFPNATLFNNIMINYSANKTRRVDVTLGVDYGCDFAKVRSVLLDIAKNNEKVLAAPLPEVLITEHAASAIQLSFRVWAKTENYWEVHFSLIEEAKLRFDAEGIKIPYNHMEVIIQK